MRDNNPGRQSGTSAAKPSRCSVPRGSGWGVTNKQKSSELDGASATKTYGAAVKRADGSGRAVSEFDVKHRHVPAAAQLPA